jgi:hypothetical protein
MRRLVLSLALVAALFFLPFVIGAAQRWWMR